MTEESVPLPRIGRPATGALAVIGVTQLDQVTQYRASDLLSLHGVGPKAIRILEAALAERGWSFRPDGGDRHPPSERRNTMSTNEPTAELDRRFSSEEATAVPWSQVLDVIERSEIFWLSTARRDGRPHVTPLPAIWLDGALHFCTGPGEQKAKNIEHNSACVLTTGTNTFRSGLDVVVEGRATRVTDLDLLQRLAQRWNDKLGWPFEAVEGGFREQSTEVAGQEFGTAAATAHVFAVAPAKILAFGKGEPFSQTRYRFES